MSKPEGFTPVRAGDVVVLESLPTHHRLPTGGYTTRYSYSLVKVTQVDDQGTVKRIKTRPQYKTEPLGLREVFIIHQDDREARRNAQAVWTANDYSWDSTEDAAEGFKAGYAAVVQNDGKPIKHGRQALDPIVA